MEDTITWVTVRSYSTPIEAHVVRGHLESEGIPCFLRDEHTIGMNWLYSNVLGGVKLCVPEQELHHAREILAGKTDDGKPAGLSCPDCGSDRLQDLGRRRNWAIFSLLAFNLPLPFAKKRYRCEVCGRAFRMGS